MTNEPNKDTTSVAALKSALKKNGKRQDALATTYEDKKLALMEEAAQIKADIAKLLREEADGYATK